MSRSIESDLPMMTLLQLDCAHDDTVTRLGDVAIPVLANNGVEISTVLCSASEFERKQLHLI